MHNIPYTDDGITNRDHTKDEYGILNNSSGNAGPGSAYPNEYNCCTKLPFARCLTLLFTMSSFAGGVRFINGLCTYGMKVVFSTSLIAFSLFTIVSIFAKKPYPMTFTFAKIHGAHALFCSLFSIYHGLLVALVASLMTFSIIINFVPMKDFLDWSCNNDDDTSGGRLWP